MLDLVKLRQKELEEESKQNEELFKRYVNNLMKISEERLQLAILHVKLMIKR